MGEHTSSLFNHEDCFNFLEVYVYEEGDYIPSRVGYVYNPGFKPVWLLGVLDFGLDRNALRTEKENEDIENIETLTVHSGAALDSIVSDVLKDRLLPVLGKIIVSYLQRHWGFSGY